MTCALPEGGLFFIAVPTGPDLLAWNAHRVYGPVRYPALANGYLLRGVVGTFTPFDGAPEIGAQQPLIAFENTFAGAIDASCKT